MLLLLLKSNSEKDLKNSGDLNFDLYDTGVVLYEANWEIGVRIPSNTR